MKWNKMNCLPIMFSNIIPNSINSILAEKQNNVVLLHFVYILILLIYQWFQARFQVFNTGKYKIKKLSCALAKN
jgi:hypothetical protein